MFKKVHNIKRCMIILKKYLKAYLQYKKVHEYKKVYEY